MMINYFYSTIFIVICFFLYSTKHTTRYALITLTSWIFYYAICENFIFVLSGISLTSYLFAHLINTQKEQRKRSYYLYGSLLFLLIPIIFYKYLIPLYHNQLYPEASFHYLGYIKISPSEYFFPLGISYFSYQSISYVLDVYRKKYEPTKNLFLYLAFVSYFPQLLIGPISRFPKLSKELSEIKLFNSNLAIEGLLLISIGLIKKMLISDGLSLLFKDLFLAKYSSTISLMTIFASPCYMFIDFSSYIDIARGISKLFNIEIPRNFDSPLTQKSISAFWSKWHMTLYNWLRDYIFFPLLSISSQKPFVYLWIIITFGLSGLWHGLEAKFMICSLLAATFVTLETIVKRSKHYLTDNALLNSLKHLYTYGIMSFIFLYYLSPNFGVFLSVLKNVLMLNSPTFKHESLLSISQIFTIGLSVIFVAFEHYRERLKKKFNGFPTIFKFSILMIITFCLVLSYKSDIKPFIYFFS